MMSDKSTQSPDRPQELRSSLEPAASASDARLIEWFGIWRKPMRSWIGTNTSVPSAEIDDLIQEVFLRLLRYSDDVLVVNPHGYLLKVAANVVNHWGSRSRVRMPHEESWLEELQIEEAQEPENAIARSCARQSIRAAIDRLPSRQRDVLLLHIEDGLTYQQIAQHLNLTHRIVMRDLTRAYAVLRIELGSKDL